MNRYLSNELTLTKQLIADLQVGTLLSNLEQLVLAAICDAGRGNRGLSGNGEGCLSVETLNDVFRVGFLDGGIVDNGYE